MTRKTALVLALGLALAVVVACDEQPPPAPAGTGSAGAWSSGGTSSSGASNVSVLQDRRGGPARSGLNSDPANPNGAPGPSRDIGTSPVR